MDPSADLPATTATPPESSAHTAHVANPTPHQLPNNNHNHPSYAEMITAAITALKEKNGSSRQAIAKYIERAYTNLPSTHSALLTHHLKRLKNSGQLVMVKHSYMLPGTRSTAAAAAAALSHSEPSSFSANPNANPNPSAPGPKRGPGRPPKPKPDSEPIGPESLLISLGLADGPGPGPGHVPVPVPVSLTLPVASGPEPEPVPVPVAISGVKRGPGRPPKGANGNAKMMMVSEIGGGAMVAMGVKRGRGRPPRPKSLAGMNLNLGIMTGQGVQKKRGRGRPPRTSSFGRPRGRPRKKTVTTLSLTGKPRGRPRKNPVAAAAAALAAVSGGSGAGGAAAEEGGGALVNAGGGSVGGMLVMPMKRRGRPPGATGVKKSPVAIGVKKPRKLSGKPLGRPRKNPSLTGGMLHSAAAQQLLAYEDLKNKVQHFQDRIKQAVSVVKPHLNSDTAVIALGALQELEELATMDLSVPVNEPPQVSVPVQVPIPQIEVRLQGQEPVVPAAPNQVYKISSF